MRVKWTYLTGDLKGDAVIDPDGTRELVPRGAWATRGILVAVVRRDSSKLKVVVVFVGEKLNSAAYVNKQ
jgi:hypothetical protein